MFLDGILLKIMGALRRLRHPTLLGPAVHTAAGRNDDGSFGRLLL